MRYTIPLLFLLFFFSIQSCKDSGINPGASVTCLPASLQDGLVAAYTFGGGSLADATLGGNDLSKSGPAVPTTDRAGNASCAYNIVNGSGATSVLTNTQTSFLNGMSDFTISIWYKPEGARGGGDFEGLMSRGNQGRCPDRRGEWSVSLYDCRRAVFAHNNSVWADLISPPSSDLCQDEMNNITGKWHHVAAVKEGDELRIYFNGVLNNTVSGVAVCSTPTHLAQDTGDLFLGLDYNGALDDILIYKRALSAQEISELYGLEACCN